MFLTQYTIRARRSSIISVSYLYVIIKDFNKNNAFTLFLTILFKLATMASDVHQRNFKFYILQMVGDNIKKRLKS